MQLSDAIEGYWLTKRRGLSDATRDDYTLTFDRLTAYLGDLYFESITAADLNRFLSHYAETRSLSAKSVSNMWIALSSLWTWAQRETGAVHIVRNGVDKPRAKQPLIQPYTEDEIRRMLAATEWGRVYVRVHETYQEYRLPHADRDQAILIVMLDCGLRVSELCALDVGDYDKRRGQLHVKHGKGDKARMVYLGESSRRSLWRYMRTRTASLRDPLFANTDGKRFTRSGILHLVQRIAKRAGIDGANVHRFRHTFAIQFLRNGGNLFALQAMLGHSTLDMVRRYARLADLDIETAQRIASPGDNWNL